MVLNRKFLVRAIVVTAAILHAIRVHRGKSLPLSILSYLGHLSTQSFLGVIAGDLVGLVILSAVWRTLRRMSLKSFSTHKNEISDWLYSLGRMIPYVENKIQAEMDKQERGIKQSLIPEGVEYLHALPKDGMSGEEILKIMETMSAKETQKWQSGRVSGGVYSGEDDHVRVMNAASNLYAVSNPLHLDLWPSLQKFESDICRMTASLLNGGDHNVVGAMTSGGTESICLAVRAHKLYAEAKRGITNPEIIACVTAHAAVEKACEMYGIHFIHVPCDPKTFEIDVNAVSRAISGDTIMVYSSAPNYATGIIDPIRRLSDLLLPQGIGLHVDCCLGGFVLPFAKKLGYAIPDFDFTCPGVTSISADTHKFGYASKGSSVVLYRNKELRRYQYFAYPKWTGGLYATATIAGSRAGSIVAATWASLVHIGENGYLEATRQILETRSKMVEGIKQIPDLQVLGNPQAMIVAFGSSRLNVYAVNDAMTRRGWALNAHQNPAAVHICVALRQIGREEEFLSDLRASVNEVRSAPKKPGEKESGSAPIYGSVSSLPPGPVKDVLHRYLDVTYSS